MHQTFEDMSSKNPDMSEEQKNAMKKLMSHPLKRRKSPFLGKAMSQTQTKSK